MHVVVFYLSTFILYVSVCLGLLNDFYSVIVCETDEAISEFLFFIIMAIVILRHPLHAAHVSFHICGIHYVIYL